MYFKKAGVGCLLLVLVSIIIIPSYAVDDGVESLRRTGKAFASVAHAVSPSVVFIQVEGRHRLPALRHCLHLSAMNGPLAIIISSVFLVMSFPEYPVRRIPTPRKANVDSWDRVPGLCF
jgi:hypothetical protein